MRTAWNLSASSAGPRFVWGPLVGVGLFHLEASGVVTPPLSAQSNDLWGFAASAGFGAQYFFDDSLSLTVDVTTLLHQPPIVIAIDDQRSSAVLLRALASVGMGVSF